MATREESLRRILDAAAGDRLSDEQKREILTHLEDSVEGKIHRGLSELEAVSQAFLEIGDLRELAKRFPKPRPVLLTPEGFTAQVKWYTPAFTSCLFLLTFFLVQTFITSKFAEVFNQVAVPIPALTVMALSLLKYWPLTLIVVLGMGFALFRVPVRWRSTVSLAVNALVALLMGAIVVGLFLPLVSLLQGIGSHQR